MSKTLAIFATAALWSLQGAFAATDTAATFATPELAAEALVTAARHNDPAEFLKIYGPAGGDLVSSGDPIADKRAHERFAERYDKGHKILVDSPDQATLELGTEAWPFPIPIVRQGGLWHFDAEIGVQEILNRRVGRNELNAIEVCRSYVMAQRDFAAALESEHKPPEYAQKFVSSPGLHDGLYWPVKTGEKESPIGPLMASARAKGYGETNGPENDDHTPYHGYFYKILTRQGPSAPGGARDYLAGSRMTGGFALLAYPAKYGDSGVKTFMISQDGIIYEKDLGLDTATVAPAITEFNPDLSWKTP